MTISGGNALRIGFMGTADFAVPSLENLCRNDLTPVVVYSQPPRPAGRRMQPRSSAVAEAAWRLGLPVETPPTLKSEAVAAQLSACRLDLIVVVAYGLILPDSILTMPPLGCINLHPSLLPRWRGAAPLQRALEAGDREGGISIIRMDSGVDTGPLLLQQHLNIPPDINGGQWHNLTAEIGAKALCRVVSAPADYPPTPQKTDGVCYAKTFRKNDLLIDFQRPAIEIHHKVRAFAPKPCCWCWLDDQRLRIHTTKIVDPDTVTDRVFGSVVDKSLQIQTGKGIIQPTSVQLEGRGIMTVGEFLRGRPLPCGFVLKGATS